MSAITFILPEGAHLDFMEHIIGPTPTSEDIAQVELNLKRIDEAWKQDIYSYSGIGGLDRKQYRIQRIHDEIQRTGKEYMPLIYLTEKKPTGLTFSDGRHRTAYLFERGYKTALFVVPIKQKELMLSFFGEV